MLGIFYIGAIGIVADPVRPVPATRSAALLLVAAVMLLTVPAGRIAVLGFAASYGAGAAQNATILRLRNRPREVAHLTSDREQPGAKPRCSEDHVKFQTERRE